MSNEIRKETNPKVVENNVRVMKKMYDAEMESMKVEGFADPREAKIMGLWEEESFKEKFLNCDSAEKVHALYLENGVEYTVDEVKAQLALMGQIYNSLLSNGELSDEELENIVGGLSKFWKKVITVASCTVAMAIGGAVLFASGGTATPLVAAAAGAAFGGSVGVFTGFGISTMLDLHGLI